MVAPATTLDPGAARREVRIARIGIERYKAIESLELELPPPKTIDEPDAFVLGSKNGVGKTSVLEACAIGMIAATYADVEGEPALRELLVRSGGQRALIDATIARGGETIAGRMTISSSGFAPGSGLSRDPLRILGPGWLPRLLGIESEPLLMESVLLFHSFRKVREGNPSIDSMVGAREPSRSRGTVEGTISREPSTFKAAVVRALMARSGLFEDVEGGPDDLIDELNLLMQEFARGRVDKLRQSPDGTLELRVAPIDGGPSYGFDGLSSGQKEVIATLFLIWQATRESPSVVLIDEPELHLNAEWQRRFVHTLWRVAPWNQYIMATHSEEVFGSVTEDRRLLLQPD